MKKLSFFLLFLLAAGCGRQSDVAVSPAEGAKIIASTPDLYLIDVRPAEAFAKKHYPNAVNMPVATFGTTIASIPADRPVLMHCRTGRSVKTAYAILKKLRPDVTNVRYIDGEPLF